MSEQKTDIMQFLKMNIHRQQKEINRLKKKISELEASNAALLEALEAAKQFIQNGIQRCEDIERMAAEWEPWTE